MFPYTNNQKEINRNNSVFDSIQKNKILMDKLSLGGKNLDTEKLRNIVANNGDLITREDPRAHRLEALLLLSWQYLPKWCTQVQSHHHLYENFNALALARQLSWLEQDPDTAGLRVWSPVKVHTGNNQWMNAQTNRMTSWCTSLSPSLPFSLSSQ